MRNGLLSGILLAGAMLAGIPAYPQATSNILDTLTAGSPPSVVSGRLVLTWDAFTAIGGFPIAAGYRQYDFTAGAINLNLVPNAGSTPSGTSYRVEYFLPGQHFFETWVVPVAPGPYTIAQVRVTTPPSTTVLFNPLTQLYAPTLAQGDLLVGSATAGFLSRLAVGANGLCLTSNGTTAAWGSCATGSGITSLNGQLGTTQTFSRVDDTNVTLAIASAVNDHGFTMGWTGTLAAARLNANVVQAVTNDTNVTGSIATQNLTLGWAGMLGLARGGTAGDLSATGGANQFVKQSTLGGALSVGAIADADVPNTITVDLAAAATALAADPAACPANQFGTDTNTAGALTCAQPSFSNLSGAATDAQVPDAITLTNITQITNRAIGDTSGDLAASRVDDGGAAATQALFSGAVGAAAFRAIADGDVPAAIARDSELPTVFYHTVKNEDGALTQRRLLNFTGAGVDCVDDGVDTTDCSIGGGGSTHEILSATHTDSTAAAVARGGLIVGKTATPKWELLTVGGANTFLGSNGTDAAWTAPTGGGPVLGTGRTLTGGAGIAALGDLSADRTIATASGETDFLALGALTCGAATQGRMQVHTTPLQYCDNAATPALQYAAYGDSTGKANIALDLQAAGSVVSNAEVDDDLTLTNLTQITNRAISDTSGTLLVGRGGSGAATLTGVLRGNGSSAFTALDSSTIGQVLRVGAGPAIGFGALDLADADAVTGTLPVGNLPSNLRVSTLGITIDGGGSAITAGVKGYLEVPFACAISRATVLADQTGSIVIDVWKDTYANYPPTVADTITASAKPTLSSAIKSQDATLTGWTTSVTAGDALGFNVDSATTVTRVHLTLKCDR